MPVPCGYPAPVRWDRLWDDLAAQAEAWEREDVTAEAGERALLEHGQVGWGDRLRGSVGHDITVRRRDGALLRGRLAACGPDWLALADAGASPLVLLPCTAVSAVHGMRATAVPVEALGEVRQRMDLRFVLRGLLADAVDVAVVWDGGEARGLLVRLGRDYLDLRSQDGPTWSIRLEALLEVNAL